MRLVICLSLLVVACTPAPAEVDDIDEVPDTGETDEVEDPYAYVRCDGAWLPDIPSRPYDLPRLTPAEGPVHEVRWDPELPDAAIDPTTAGFDPLSLVPDTLLDRMPLAMPQVPQDPGDQTGALMLQRRFDDGGWTDVHAERFDEQGRVVASWEAGGLVLTRWDADGRSFSTRELFFRDTWQPQSQESVVVGDGVRLASVDRYPGSGGFDGEWREQSWMVHVDRGAHGLLEDRMGVSLDGEQPDGVWLRELDLGIDLDEADAGEPTWRGVVWAHVDQGYVRYPSRPVLLGHGDRVRADYPDTGQTIVSVVCPSDDPDVPDEKMSFWLEDPGATPTWVRVHLRDGEREIDRVDQDGDGVFEEETVTTFDEASGIRTQEHWQVVDGERVLVSTLTEEHDERGVLMHSLVERSDGSKVEYRRVRIE